MNYVSGGIAKKIAETAIEIAQNRDEEQEEARDHLYWNTYLYFLISSIITFVYSFCDIMVF